jgi:hypothetical protein
MLSERSCVLWSMRGSAVIAAILLASPADAVELEIGARFPAEANEAVVVRNDSGIRNANNSFAFGQTCYSHPYTKTWFIVKKVIEGQVLIELECSRTVFDNLCPNGTETSKPLTETQARVKAHGGDFGKIIIELREGRPSAPNPR